jgi:hypothetical protein
LIAPREVRFYATNWTLLGEKAGLIDVIYQATGIDVDMLRGGDMAEVGVATRMSWAAHRKTTREEDIAYCLMDMVDVNMPMLYGEGRKAFIRLQEKILKETEDQSLFAWCATPESAAEAPFRGLLASSPDEFAGSAEIVPFPNVAARETPTTSTSRRIRLTSVVRFDPYRTVNDSITQTAQIGLNCRWVDDVSNVIGLEIRRAKAETDSFEHGHTSYSAAHCMGRQKYSINARRTTTLLSR